MTISGAAGGAISHTARRGRIHRKNATMNDERTLNRKWRKAIKRVEEAQTNLFKAQRALRLAEADEKIALKNVKVAMRLRHAAGLRKTGKAV